MLINYLSGRHPSRKEGVHCCMCATGQWWPPACISFAQADRKSTRLNSSHLVISYAVFCLKKKKSYLLKISHTRSQVFVLWCTYHCYDCLAWRVFSTRSLLS